VACALNSLSARLAVQNRTVEAGEMDLLRQLRETWTIAEDHETAAVMDGILADEIQHVRFANQWLHRFAHEPQAVMQMAAALNFAGGVMRALQPQPGERSLDNVELAAVDHAIEVNTEDRHRAGFTQAEIADLVRQGRSSDLKSQSHTES